MIRIRSERPADYAAIGAIHLQAFGGEQESRLVAALRETDGFDPGLSLVAERDGALVGHILFSGAAIETGRGEVPALALAPMAVLPEHQRAGIGSDLVRTGLEVCRRKRHRIVIVVGHADYYPRFGFVPARSLGLEAPFDVADEAFLARELASGALTDVRGMLRYSAPFASL